jgi:hypothetical protein
MSVSRAPATGWYLEVDLSDEDTRRLRPAGEPTWSPTINDLPTIEIPVRAADDIWTRGRADGATVRVYKDGVKLPFERVSEVNRRRGNGRSEVLLTCVGGVDLNKRVQRVYQNKPVPDAVRDLISSETDLIANVDDAGGGGSVSLVSADTGSALGSDLSVALDGASLGDFTVPLNLNTSANRIERLQTAWLWVADNDFTPESGAVLTGDSGAEQGVAAKLTNTFDGVTTPTRSVAYKIPEGSVGVAVHARRASSVTPGDVQLNVGAGGGGAFVSGLSTDYQWLTASAPFADVPLDPGVSVSVELETDTEVYVSGAVVYDERAEPDTFDDNPDPYFAGPGPFDGGGPATRLETGEEVAPQTLEGAETEVALAAGSPADSLQVTARTPADETTATGSTTATVEPGKTADRASGSVTLSGSGTQSGSSPETAAVAHDLDSFDLRGLSTGERRLIGQSFDDDLLNVLQTIAEESGSIWAVESAPAGGLSLEWSRPGSRDPQGSLSPAAVDVDRITQRVEAATVRGGRRRRAEEIVAPDPTSGTPSTVAAVGGETVGEAILGARPGDSATSVGLSFGNLIPGTERVVRVSDGTEFDPIQDYRLDYLRGEFRLVQTGDISPGDTLEITYQHKPTGRFEAGQFGGDPRADQTFDIGRATTPSACQQAAQRIVRQTPAARIEARVDVSDLDPTTSVIRSLGVAELDIPQEFDIQGFDNAPGDSVIRLGTARPVEEIVASVARDIGDVSQRI